VVFLAVPAYGGVVLADNVRSVVNATNHPPEGMEVFYSPYGTSLLCATFNALWAVALNARMEADIRWWVLLHSDMGVLETDWLPRLLGEAEANGLDAIAAHARIKDPTENTSTALWDGSACERVSVKTALEWPVTMTAEQAKADTGKVLCINTGCLAIRFDAPWVGQVDERGRSAFCFAMEDGVDYRDGKFMVRCVPEDWRMSLWFNEHGIRYGATRAVHTAHGGHVSWGFPEG
jgi:hypothetical protein